MLLYLPPLPFTAQPGMNLQLALEVRDVKTSDRELLTPSTMPQKSTLATNSANVKGACQNSQSSRMSCGLRGKNDPPHTCSRLQTLLDERRAEMLPLCCQDADPCELTTMKLQLFPLPIHSNNQCYFIFNRLDSPNKGKYF